MEKFYNKSKRQDQDKKYSRRLRIPNKKNSE